MKGIVLCWGLVCGVGAAAAADRGEELAYINAALKSWLAVVAADTPYLLVDRSAAELRLMHGKAVMRNMALVADSLGARPPSRLSLQSRLRYYRPSDSWRGLMASPFDWEQNLVLDASPMSALYFTDGLLVYASAVWHRPKALALQLEEQDLRALYNACKSGMALVVLPAGWKEGQGL